MREAFLNMCGRWNSSIRTIAFFVLLSAAVLAAGGTAGAGMTLNWTNASGGFWDISSNWSPAKVPALGDEVMVSNAGSSEIIIRNNAALYALVLNSGQLALTSGSLTITSELPPPPPSLTRLTLILSGDGSGRVTSNPPGLDCTAGCFADFNQGSSVTLTAQADPDSLFTGWSAAGCSDAVTCAVTMSEARTVTAAFARQVAGEPTAAFTLSPDLPKVNQLVQFSDKSTGIPASWEWNFGDGALSTLQNPTHAYAAAGTFTITLKVVNGFGNSSVTRDLVVSPAFTIAETISDQAQSMTIAFDGLAFVTGSFCTQTFYPPGKVADFFGFQYLRDNDLSAMGHNTDFTTLTADPILVLLNDAQLQTLSALGSAEASLNDNYGYARFPLAKAFRRLNGGDLPAGRTGLSREAVKAYAAYLFSIDGEMSYMRAQAYASVLGSMDATQQAALAAMKGKGSLQWTQPTQTQIDAVLKKYPGQMMRTYAGEMLAWYLGSIDADVYFCPERQGTYFGSFFMKDIKAMNNPSYTIDSNMTADMGNAFLAALDTTQKGLITGLVAEQKTDLLSIVAKREELSATLRNFLSAGGSVSKAAVINLARQYGELDGELSYFYATNFSAVGTSLTPVQQTALTALRKTATAETGGTPDYDTLCGNGYLYSAPLQSEPTVMNTDFMFGVCGAAGSACTTEWDCCSFSCSSNVCGADFSLTSPAFVDGGTLPGQYTCDGTGGMLSPNPPLAWTGAPEGTVEYALTISTLANDGTRWNWVLYHIPGSATSLAEGTAVGTAGVSTDGPELRYYPPCSTGPGEKTYTFTLYALSGVATLPETGVTGEVLTSAISPLVISSRQINVTYTRTGL